MFQYVYHMSAFTPEMRVPQETWIETFLEGVTDKSTGLTIFKELVWFAYKVSAVMCSVSACEHCWSIEGWIHSKRRNKLHPSDVSGETRSRTHKPCAEGEFGCRPS